MAYSACSLGPPGSGRQNESSSSPPFLTRFLSGRHISAVFASFSGFSPPFGSLVAYPVGSTGRRWAATSWSGWEADNQAGETPFSVSSSQRSKNRGGTPTLSSEQGISAAARRNQDAASANVWRDSCGFSIMDQYQTRTSHTRTVPLSMGSGFSFRHQGPFRSRRAKDLSFHVPP